MPARPFPAEPVRDLIGILRSLYAHVAAERRPSRTRLAAIERIASELVAATRMARGHDAGTAPVERAIAMADGAMVRLGALVADQAIVGWDPRASGLLRTASRRIRGKWKPKEPTERELKWACGKQRG